MRVQEGGIRARISAIFLDPRNAPTGCAVRHVGGYSTDDDDRHDPAWREADYVFWPVQK